MPSDLKSQEVRYGEELGSGGTDAILSSFFRHILSNLGIDGNRFQALLDRYVLSQGLANNTVEVGTSRSALRREFMSPTMTWNVFVKGLMFLRADEVRMTVFLFREDDLPTIIHEQMFHINSKAAEEETEGQNLLGEFYRNILMEQLFIDVKSAEYSAYLDRYVKFSKPNSTPSEQYTHKCSIKREVSKESISWKVFVKGILVLGTRKMVMQMEVLYQNKIIKLHEKSFVFR